MPEFIYHYSSTQLFLFICIVLLIFSIVSINIIHRYIPLNVRYRENTAIVSCSALLGIIYAILIGFIILYALSAIDKTEKDENLEGVTLYGIYYNAALLPEPNSSYFQSLVLGYANNAVYNEWPAMVSGDKIDSKGSIIIGNMIHATHKINSTTLDKNAATALIAVEQDIAILFKLHHLRIATVHTTLSGHIWFVLLLGTLFTLGINFFLGMEYRFHLFCVSLIAIIMSAIIYLIVALERPYQGDFIVRPDTIETVLDEMQGMTQK